MPSIMAQWELAAIIKQRQFAQENGLSMSPSMEESYRMLPALQAGLDQALDMILLLDQHPELAAHIPPGGVPQE
jgi:hypothetical protein